MENETLLQGAQNSESDTSEERVITWPDITKAEPRLSTKMRRILAAGLLAISGLGATYAQNEADADGGYPWDAAQPTGQLSAFRLNGSIYDQNGFAYRNCTSYVAWKLGTLGVRVPYGANLGNATTWDNNAPRFGYAVDGAPRVGDAAVWDGAWGHVAYVEAVDTKNTASPVDDTVTVSEYNYSPPYAGRYGVRSGVKAPHYIHFLKQAAPPTPTQTPTPGGPRPTPGWERPHVYQMLHHNSPYNNSELKIFDSRKDYKDYLGGWQTPEGQHSGDDYDFVVGDVNADGIVDGLGLLHQNTGSGMTEVHIIDGAKSYQGWQGGYTSPDGWHRDEDVSYALGDINRDGRKDLVSILHYNTGSGMTEVRVYDGAHSFTRWLGGWQTIDPWTNEHDVTYTMGDYNRDGILDLYKIAHKNTTTARIEAHIMDGATNFRSWLAHLVLPEWSHDGEDVDYGVGQFSGPGSADIYQIQHRLTPSGHTEVRIYSQSSSYSKLVGAWAMPEYWHDTKDAVYAVPS